MADQALAGYRVLDLSAEIGHFCGKLLAGMGAEVVKVEPPEGDDLRRCGPFYRDEPGPERSLRWWLLNTGKRGITLDLKTAEGRALFERLLEKADVVVESWTPAEAAALGVDRAALCARHPHLIWASITGFGQDGPYADFRYSDLIGQAMGGLMYLIGDPDRPPVRMGPPQAIYHASLQAAVGIAAALVHRTRGGTGQFLDISMQEAMTYTLTGPGTNVNWWVQNGVIVRRTGSRLNFGERTVPVIQPCADGEVANGGGGMVGTALERLLPLMRADGITTDLEDPKWQSAVVLMPAPGQWQMSQEEIDHATEEVNRWLARHTKKEIYRFALEHDLMWYPVNDPKDLTENEQLAARAYWQPIAHEDLGQSFTYPGAPYKLSATPWSIRRRAPKLGEDNEAVVREWLSAGATGSEGARPHPAPLPAGGRLAASSPRPLDGVKVAEFGWLAAGPLTAQWLAHLGATVVRVESAFRLDGLRQFGPFAGGKRGINRSLYFNAMNCNKLGITLNLNTAKGQEAARRLIRWADVMIDNFTPQALRRWGLDYESTRDLNPDLVMIALAMQGQTGPHAQTAASGPMLQGLCGLAHLTGWPDRGASGATIPYPDFTSPHLAAFAVLAALDYRARTGRGQFIDMSQFEAFIHLLDAPVLDYTVNGRVARRAGNDLMAGDRPRAYPHGAYPCAGEDRWIAIAVLDDADWRRLVEAMGRPPWALNPALATLDGRLAARDEIDLQLSDWTEGQEAHDLMAVLQAAGVPAGVVQNVRDIWEDVQLRHRGHFQMRTHPAMGEIPIEMPAVRFSATPVRLEHGAPMLGEHNDYVFTELLGYSQEEYDLLIAEGVVEYYEGD